MIFKREQWRRFSEPPADIQQIILSMSIDSAFKTGAENDYSVVQVWGQTATGYYLLHVWRGRVEFPKLKAQAIELASLWRPTAVLIEAAAAGQSLIQSLRNETALPVLPIKVSSDKVSRAHAVTPPLEAGRVYLPDQAPWLIDFLDELSSFPASPHDDQVDSLTQALNYIRGLGSFNIMEHYKRLSAAPAPANNWRDDPLDSIGQRAPQPPFWSAKTCKHCQEPIPDGTVFVKEPGAVFNRGVPFYAQAKCAQDALAGIFHN